MKKVIAIVLLVMLLCLSACAPKAINYVAVYGDATQNNLNGVRAIGGGYDVEKMLEEDIFLSITASTAADVKHTVTMRFILSDTPNDIQLALSFNNGGSKKEIYIYQSVRYDVTYASGRPSVTSKQLTEEQLKDITFGLLLQEAGFGGICDKLIGACEQLELNSAPLSQLTIGDFQNDEKDFTNSQSNVEARYAYVNGQYKTRFIINLQEPDSTPFGADWNITFVHNKTNLLGVKVVSDSAVSTTATKSVTFEKLTLLLEHRELSIVYPSYVKELFE